MTPHAEGKQRSIAGENAYTEAGNNLTELPRRAAVGNGDRGGKRIAYGRRRRNSKPSHGSHKSYLSQKKISFRKENGETGGGASGLLQKSNSR